MSQLSSITGTLSTCCGSSTNNSAVESLRNTYKTSLGGYILLNSSTYYLQGHHNYSYTKIITFKPDTITIDPSSQSFYIDESKIVFNNQNANSIYSANTVQPSAIQSLILIKI